VAVQSGPSHSSQAQKAAPTVCQGRPFFARRERTLDRPQALPYSRLGGCLEVWKIVWRAILMLSRQMLDVGSMSRSRNPSKQVNCNLSRIHPASPMAISARPCHRMANTWHLLVLEVPEPAIFISFPLPRKTQTLAENQYGLPQMAQIYLHPHGRPTTARSCSPSSIRCSPAIGPVLSGLSAPKLLRATRLRRKRARLPSNGSI
jgi:hypothetical protein